MKIFKFTAFVLAAALALAPAAGCKHDIKSSSETVKNNDISATVVSAEIAQEIDVNDTIFTLNRVIDAGAQTEDGGHYIYLDITVKNVTPNEYTLSTLNNFYITLPDGSEISSAVRTQLYAKNNFTDKYFGSPFTVPANSTFTGVIGGFVLAEGQNEFTLGFFPTREERNDKSNVIKVQVTASDIVQLPDDLKK